MRALVVVESMFGNTRAVADAVGRGLGGAVEVEVVRVDEAPSQVPAGVGLLVVGGPTHAFGMSRASTRADAQQQAGGETVTSVAIGMREWIEGLGPPAGEVLAATFDTRVRRPRVPGSAARKAEKALRRRGYRIAHSATTFWVDGTPGPLVEGELDRATEWGVDLAARATAPGRHPGTHDRWPMAS